MHTVCTVAKQKCILDYATIVFKNKYYKPKPFSDDSDLARLPCIILGWLVIYTMHLVCEKKTMDGKLENTIFTGSLGQSKHCAVVSHEVQFVNNSQPCSN